MVPKDLQRTISDSTDFVRFLTATFHSRYHSPAGNETFSKELPMKKDNGRTYQVWHAWNLFEAGTIGRALGQPEQLSPLTTAKWRLSRPKR
jgi:hypothetical protein